MLTLPLEARKPASPLLGVIASARGLQWRSRLPLEKTPVAAAISQRHGLHELLGRILAARGASPDDVPDIINPTLKRLMPDPFAFLDMDKGAERLARAIIKREPIAIFGDYDVDGAASSALLKLYLGAHGLPARIYIPDRLSEGYGPNPDAIAALIEEGARLLLTVDCGTTSHDALEVAARRAVDVIVVDHHQAPEVLPRALAIINPNRQDDLSRQGHLSAAGVLFLLLAATTRKLRLKGFYAAGAPEPDLLAWLDLVALSTVCDVVPIQGVNRAFVAQGLKVMRHRRNPGLRALADAARLNAPPSPHHLGFVLGPRINAGGRIGDAALGARLLSTADVTEAERIAATLDRLNRERQDMEAQMLQEAAGAAEAQLAADPECPLIVVASETYHKGIAGLLASRLADQFQRPSLVIAWDDAGGHGTGSARSVQGVDIGRAVHAAVEAGLALKGGGHAMAAGVTVSRADYERFREHMRAALSGETALARLNSSFEIDGVLTAAGASEELLEQVEQAGPYGAGNPQPRFAFASHTLAYVKPAGASHLRCRIKGPDGTTLEGVAFRAAGTPLGDCLIAAGGRVLHFAGRLNRNCWGGRESVELMIEDAADPLKQHPA
mgnify:CR=1 FL=1